MPRAKHLLLVAAILGGVLFPARAGEGGRATTFWERQSEGWWWHEPEPEPKKKEEPKEELPPPAPAPQQPPPPTEAAPQPLPPAGPPAFSVAWFKVNLPKIRDIAIDNPTRENVLRYQYAQRAAMDKATRFMESYTVNATFDPHLNESLRRPETQASLNVFKQEQREANEELTKSMSDRVGLFFFYSSTCGACAEQTRYLYKLQDLYGWEILPISVDGGPVPADTENRFANYRVITQQELETYVIAATPTLYLADRQEGGVFLLATGLAATSEIAERATLLAREQGLISEDEYNRVASVRDVSTIPNPSPTGSEAASQPALDQARVYADENYLVDYLRGRLTGDAPPMTDGNGVMP